ncbi:MAG: response regulator transcription factor [Ruminococcaceae bacterium]|nr:response regulator transcription factor [Oscillospiraceae bacterium]
MVAIMKVLVADDEPDVRMGLKQIIDWHALGFDICGEASNGEECLTKMVRLNPELVLLDIRMPKMHGLECAKAAREQGWNGKIIILSGYSDFQYAQDAIRCGVETYLLKPIDETELEEAVRKIHEKIEKERRQFQRMNFAMEKARKTVLTDLLSGKVNSGSGENAEILGFHEDGYQAVILEREEDGPSPYSDSLQLERLLQGPMAERLRLPEMNVFLLRGSDTIRKFESITQTISGKGRFLAVGRTVQNAEEICLSYQDACRIFARRFFFDRNRFVFRPKDLPKELKPCEIGNMNLKECAEKLFAFLQAGNLESACAELERLHHRIKEMDVKQDDVVNYLINIYTRVKHAVWEEYKLNESAERSDAEIIAEISRKKRLYEIIDYMKDGLRRMDEGLSGLRCNNIVERVKHYIEKNYGSNLKLELLAQSFGYNSAYLGKLFKNTTGENFNSYLDRIRIEKAKKLLAQKDLRVYEISRRVGYDNIDYFYIKFHKYMNESPTEYRKHIEATETMEE